MASKNGKFLTREQILGAPDIKKRTVSVPEWGGSVMVYAMTGREREEIEEIAKTPKGNDVVDDALFLFRATLCSYAIRDEDGNRLFSLEDIKALGEKSVTALIKVTKVVNQLSGILPEDVDQLVKNSESDPNADSGLDSQPK